MTSKLSKPTRWKRRVLYFAIGLFVAYLAGCYWLAGRYLSPPQYDNPRDPIFTLDHLGQSSLWTVTPKDPKAVFILCHGYQGRQAAWTEVARFLGQDGYAIFVPSFPGHDSHPDPVTGFGLKERDIIGEVASLARTRYPKHAIVVVGISMGGAAAWLASEKFPDRIDAIATEGAFTRMNDATNCYFDRALPGGRYLLAPVRWIAQSKSGVDPMSINPVESAMKWRGKPALVMHGALDQVFPVAFAQELGQATGTEPWIIPGAGHAYGFATDPTGYIARLEALASEARS